MGFEGTQSDFSLRELAGLQEPSDFSFEPNFSTIPIPHESNFGYLFETFAGIILRTTLTAKNDTLFRYNSEHFNEIQRFNNMPDYVVTNTFRNEIKAVYEVKSGMNLSGGDRLRNMAKCADDKGIEFHVLLYDKSFEGADKSLINPIMRRAPNANILSIKELNSSDLFTGTHTYHLLTDKGSFFQEFGDEGKAPDFLQNLGAVFDFYTTKRQVELKLMREMLNFAPILPHQTFEQRYF